MIPYNNCENKWLSKAKKNYRKHQPIYEIILGTSALIVCILTLLTALSSIL
jgi:hypothetical protein